MVDWKNNGIKKMKAVILVGGLGTRLRPLTDNKPKPIVPVINRPFLEHTITHLRKFGIKDIIFAMSYLPDAINEYFQDGKRFGVLLKYSIEKDPLGTAGAVKNAERYLDSPFIVLNGDDVFFDMNFEEVSAFHCKKNAQVTIFLTQVDNPSAYGVVETDDNQRVKRFIEKPPPGTETTNWINAGGYILNPEVLQYIPLGKHYMFEKGLFPNLLELGKPVYSYKYKGYWQDMGTLMKYYSLNMDLLNLKLNSPLVNLPRKNILMYGTNTDIDPTAEITAPCIIDNDCRIGRGVRIKGPAVIGRGSVLEDDSVIEETIIWRNVRIGSGSRLSRCIAADDTEIGENITKENEVITPAGSVPLK
jgi:NDP-sugar pyrophosphorylase family protein